MLIQDYGGAGLCSAGKASLPQEGGVGSGGARPGGQDGQAASPPRLLSAHRAVTSGF